MATGPVTALVMHPVVQQELFRNDHVRRLDNCCRLVSESPSRDFDELGEHLSRIQILITSWGCPRIDAKVIADMPQLKLIAHLAGSVKGFVAEDVWRRGIKITNAVAANAIPVAEYTLAAILFANKRVFQLHDFYLQHKENRAPWTREAPEVGNYRKRVGIVGASQVGRKVIDLLKPFDNEILVYDPYLSPLKCRELQARKVGLSELMSHSDVVSIHAPLLAETRHLIGARELSLMQDHATLINTARGGIVDQAALINTLSSGRLFAILDTTEPEVLPVDSPLFRLPNVFLTPHIAGSMGSETQRLTDYIIDELERFTQNRTLKYGVRVEDLARLA